MEQSVEKFFKKSVWSLSSVIFRTVGNLTINKLIALNFGTTGITLIAHFQNLISLLTQVPNDGVNRGLIKYCSNSAITECDRKNFFNGALILNIALYFLGLILVFFFGEYIWRNFPISISVGHFFLLFSIATFLFIINLLILSVILSRQQIRQYAIINIISTVVLVLFVWVGSLIHKFDILLLLFITGHALTLVISLTYVLRKRLIPFGKKNISVISFKNLGEFVLMAASVLLFSKLLDFVVRDYAIRSFGFQQTGLWQSVVRLSEGYMMVFINTVGVVYYPQIASLIFDSDQLRGYLQGVIKVVVPVTAIGLITVFFLRDPILTILYSSKFIAAGDLMPFQLIGDFFCILSYLLTYIISAQARTREFIALQAGSAGIYISFIVLLSGSHGIMALPEAHALRFFIVFVILVILNKRILF